VDGRRYQVFRRAEFFIPGDWNPARSPTVRKLIWTPTLNQVDARFYIVNCWRSTCGQRQLQPVGKFTFNW
jgi:hypothetical protein